MEALIEQRMRELLKEAYSDGYHAGRRGLVYEALDEHQGSSIGQLTTEVWKLLTYHAGRGDAAQEYIEAFFTGARDWKEFRWNEVWDRMHAVEPINLGGDMYDL